MAGKRAAAMAAAAIVLLGCVLACSARAATPFIVDGTITAPGGHAGQAFGTSVAVSGDILAVQGNLSGGGNEVSVFQRAPGGSWARAPRVAVLSAGGAYFGRVAISGDVIVAGSYVWVKPPAGWANASSSPSATLSPAPTLVAIDGDVIVGAGFYGGPFVWKKPPGGWTGTVTSAATLTTSATESYYISSVALSGDTAAFGDTFDQKVFVFTRPPIGGWVNASNPAVFSSSSQSFGVSVATDSSVVAVGVNNSNSNAGAVALFARKNGIWANSSAPDASLTASVASDARYLGSAVAISGDRIVASAPGLAPVVPGAFIFRRPASG